MTAAVAHFARKNIPKQNTTSKIYPPPKKKKKKKFEGFQTKSASKGFKKA